VVLYLGSLNPDKRIDLLLAAMSMLRQRRGDVELVVAGDGPLRDMVRQAADAPWVHWIGAVSGRTKAAWLRRSAILMTPAAVGLVILDAFAAGRVLITSDAGNHGPEICYLKDQVNGRMVPAEPTSLANATLALLTDHAGRSRMEAAARADAMNYSIDRMSQHFAEGIVRALEAPRRSRAFI
jgi:glycosyltransferase involved in cell wall biosynthesis